MMQVEGADWPDPMSEPCSGYVKALNEVLRWVALPIDLASHIDESAEVAARAMARYHEELGEPEKAKEIAEHQAGRKPMVHQVQDFADLVFEMTLCRVVDNYLAYLGELLALTFRCRPETMRSSDQVSYEFVLTHDTMDDLVGALAERRVERLSYAGFPELNSFFEERLGFALFDGEEQKQAVVRAIEIRNLIVHRRAVVDRRFLDRVDHPDAKLGNRLPLRATDVSSSSEVLSNAVRLTEANAAAKWSLPQPVALSDVTGGNRTTTNGAEASSDQAD